MVTMDLKVTAVSEEDLAAFVQLCMIIQEAGIQGTGVKIPVFVDGDGSGRFAFHVSDEKETKELPRIGKDFDLDNLNTLWLGE